MAPEQAQVAGLFLSLNFRLQIGQFDAGMEGITPCSVALKRHLKHPPRKLCAGSQLEEATRFISRRDSLSRKFEEVEGSEVIQWGEVSAARPVGGEIDQASQQNRQTSRACHPTAARASEFDTRQRRVYGFAQR